LTAGNTFGNRPLAVKVSAVGDSDTNNALKKEVICYGLRSITAINAALNTTNPAIQGQIAPAEGHDQPLDAVLRLITEVADTNPNLALVQTWKGIGRSA
jgi:hypothetical protein